jgi:hypothetical protein
MYEGKLTKRMESHEMKQFRPNCATKTATQTKAHTENITQHRMKGGPNQK